MRYLYSFGIILYEIAIKAFSIFNKKAAQFVSGRQNIFQQLKILIAENKNIIWIHCASVGEFEQGRPLIELIKAKQPHYKILLTFFSPSGYELRKNYDKADFISYLPIDTLSNARKFVSIANPVFAIFVKYEFWQNYLYTLKQKQIPVYSISSIFRQEQIFFKPYGKWFLKGLKSVEHFFVQDKNSAQILNSVGINAVSVTGDTRFDRVAQIAAAKKNFSHIERFASNSTVLIAGSTWQADEDILIEFINSTKHNLKYIIAPHEIHETKIERLKNAVNVPCIKYSEIEKLDVSVHKVLIINNIGMLSSLYQYGNLAYIGGGFGSGIHNILEAATFSIPVVFGPNHKKFKEAVDLKTAGGAFSINNFHEFNLLMNTFFETADLVKNSGKIAGNYVKTNTGGTEKIFEKLCSYNLFI